MPKRLDRSRRATEGKASSGVDRWKRPWTCVLTLVQWQSEVVVRIVLALYFYGEMENRTECKASAKCDGWVKSDAFCRLDSPCSVECAFSSLAWLLSTVICSDVLLAANCYCIHCTASEPEGRKAWLETETGLVVANAKGLPH